MVFSLYLTYIYFLAYLDIIVIENMIWGIKPILYQVYSDIHNVQMPREIQVIIKKFSAPLVL